MDQSRKSGRVGFQSVPGSGWSGEAGKTRVPVRPNGKQGVKKPSPVGEGAGRGGWDKGDLSQPHDLFDGQGADHGLGRAAQAVGGVYRLHDGSAAVLGHHNGHDLPLGVEL